MKFGFLASFLVFVVWLTYEISKYNKIEANSMKNFWAKEHQANSVRKKSLDNLNYIQIPLERLPMDILTDNEAVTECLDLIRQLADTKIVNLTGISNTDLKLTYGTANITVLSEYDQNYTLLARTIYKWGELLYQEGFVTEAKRVLEFGIETNTDVSGNYKLLASIYLKEGEKAKLDSLFERAGNLQSLMKNPILKALNDICHNEE